MSSQKTQTQSPPAASLPGRPLRVVVSGGGSGGHVFPAIAIADAVKEALPDTEFLFVGARDKIEMEKVPRAGYRIEGLWISGLQRKLTLRNLSFPLKVIDSLLRAYRILRRFRPDVVVGVGGFASGPVLEVASRLSVPTLIQEQNSYAGLTNKLLANRADKICVAYPGMERYFPADKIIMTGNPVRNDLRGPGPGREEAAAHFGLRADQPIVLVFGGSLGAQSINEAMEANAGKMAERPDVQWLWQAGKLYFQRFQGGRAARLPQVRLQEFIDRMDLAYAMADLVVCRAGALTLSELCLVGKPALLIPSPNVAEDHQTKNALALVQEDAAELLPDAKAAETLGPRVMALLDDGPRRAQLAGNIRGLARPDAARTIAREVIALAKTRSSR